MSWTAERARVASLSRSRTPDDPDLVDARLNLRTEKLAEHIERVVNAAPPLDDARRDRLAALLRPSAPAGDERSLAAPAATGRLR